ncbi:MAG: hypothetical protein H6Q73_1057 [Firmicutes bacterium]|nr:hypothetical protein [Bacillota bacterium]
MKCLKCEKDNDDTSEYCVACEAPLLAQPTTIDTSPPISESDSSLADTSMAGSDFSEKKTFWRKIVGFRSKTRWMVLASLVCGLIIIAVIVLKSNLYQSAGQNTVAVAKMYQEADGFLKGKNYGKAQQVLNDLIQRYPDSSEAAQAKAILTQIDTVVRQEEEAKAQEAAIKKAKQSAALSMMRSRYDEAKNVTWYHASSTTQYRNDTDFYIYIGKYNTGNIELKFRIQFCNDNWINIKRYVIKADEQTFAIIPNSSDIKREALGGIYVESMDVLLDADKCKVVKAVAASNKTILRVEGDKYYKDRVISAEEKNAIQNILLAYEALGGTN